MKAAGTVASHRTDENGVVVQVDICVEIECDGRAIFESFVGWGQSPPEAVSQAMNCFSIDCFHVLLAALFDKVDEQQVEIQEWEIAGTPRQVTIGPLRTRGKAPVHAEQGQKLTECLDWLRTALKRHAFSRGIHWARFFYAQEAGRLISCEALRDNETWQELESEMAELEWPVSEEFYSVRNFLIIKDR